MAFVVSTKKQEEQRVAENGAEVRKDLSGAVVAQGLTQHTVNPAVLRFRDPTLEERPRGAAQLLLRAALTSSEPPSQAEE